MSRIKDIGVGFVIGAISVVSIQATYMLIQEPDRPPYVDHRAVLDRDNVLILVNEARLKNGAKQVGEDPEIKRTAQYIAEKVSTTNKCSHEFLTEKRETGEQVYKDVSENLACDVTGARQAVEGLLASPTHAQSLTDPKFTRIGIGISGNDLVIHLK